MELTFLQRSPGSVPHVLLEFCCLSQGFEDPGPPLTTKAKLRSCSCSPGRGRCCSSPLNTDDQSRDSFTPRPWLTPLRAAREVTEPTQSRVFTSSIPGTVPHLPRLTPCPGLWGSLTAVLNSAVGSGNSPQILRVSAGKQGHEWCH